MMIVQRHASAFDVQRAIEGTIKDFLDYICNDVLSEHPDVYAWLCEDDRHLREVFRHSLCTALNLQSSLAFPNKAEFCDECMKRMCVFVGEYITKPVDFRQGVLQAGVSGLTYTTKKKGGARFDVYNK